MTTQRIKDWQDRAEAIWQQGMDYEAATRLAKEIADTTSSRDLRLCARQAEHFCAVMLRGKQRENDQAYAQDMFAALRTELASLAAE